MDHYGKEEFVAGSSIKPKPWIDGFLYPTFTVGYLNFLTGLLDRLLACADPAGDLDYPYLLLILRRVSGTVLKLRSFYRCFDKKINKQRVEMLAFFHGAANPIPALAARPPYNSGCVPRHQTHPPVPLSGRRCECLPLQTHGVASTIESFMMLPRNNGRCHQQGSMGPGENLSPIPHAPSRPSLFVAQFARFKQHAVGTATLPISCMGQPYTAFH